jgi:hypothetical protein
MKRLLVAVPALALALSGCFIVSKKPSLSSQSSTAAPKNHGQERSEEVHERNAERKEQKDEMKDAKKASTDKN